MRKAIAVILFVMLFAASAFAGTDCQSRLKIAEAKFETGMTEVAESMFNEITHDQGCGDVSVITRAQYLLGKISWDARNINFAAGLWGKGKVPATYGKEILPLFEDRANAAFKAKNWEVAKESFIFAIKFGGSKAAYIEKMFNGCKSMLEQEKVSDGLTLGQAVIALDPSDAMKVKVGEKMFEHGKKLADDSLFNSAMNMRPKDEKLRKDIAAFYHAQYVKSNNTNLHYLNRAAELDPEKYKVEKDSVAERVGRTALMRALELAKKADPTPAEVEELELKKAIARANLAAEVMEREAPEVFILKAREELYRFDLKKSERTPFRFHGEQGVRTAQEFSSTNGKYEIHFANGAIVKIWAGEKCSQEENNEDFYLVAVEDVKIFINVKKR